MRRNIATLFLQYARLDRKRGVGGLSPLEEEIWRNLRLYLGKRLNPDVPKGADRRESLRVATEIGCRWVQSAPVQEAHLTSLSRSGAFLRTPAPAPVGEKISIRIALPEGGAIEVPAIVANQFLGGETHRRGMGVRFGPMSPETMKVLDALYERSIIDEFGKPDETDPPLVDANPGEPA
jgi:hypothetical protein